MLLPAGAATVRLTTPDGRVLCDRCAVARSWPQRLRGLLGTPAPAPGEGLLLPRCASVHTVGMRHAIEVVFLDGDGGILAVVPELRPGRAAGRRRARAVVEAAPGSCGRARIGPGDRLVAVDRVV